MPDIIKHEPVFIPWKFHHGIFLRVFPYPVFLRLLKTISVPYPFFLFIQKPGVSGRLTGSYRNVFDKDIPAVFREDPGYLFLCHPGYIIQACYRRTRIYQESIVLVFCSRFIVVMGRLLVFYDDRYRRDHDSYLERFRIQAGIYPCCPDRHRIPVTEAVPCDRAGISVFRIHQFRIEPYLHLVVFAHRAVCRIRHGIRVIDDQAE